MNSGAFTIVIVVVLLLFVVYRRATNLLTRQKVRPHALAVRLGIFAVLGLLVLALSITNPLGILADLVGLAIGGVVAWYSLRLTVFDRQPDGLYYMQNRYIGLGVFVVFVVRFAYKMVESISQAQATAQQVNAGGNFDFTAQFAGDPLTNSVYFLLIGYYAFYYAMLLMRNSLT